MTRTTRTALSICALLAPIHVLAQETAEPPAQAPATPKAPTIEWAIAPPGTVLPEGTVLSEEIVLPPGTLLPGGAVLPQSSTPAVPTSTPPHTLAPATPAPVSTLPGQSSLGVPHISGGIGASEREAMEAVKSQYNLRVLFAVAGSGAYLSNIRVQIKDVAGPVLLTTVTIGPWLYANLAPGEYVLTVEHAGQAQTRQVRIPETGATAESFYWPAP